MASEQRCEALIDPDGTPTFIDDPQAGHVGGTDPEHGEQCSRRSYTTVIIAGTHRMLMCVSCIDDREAIYDDVEEAI